MNMTVREAVPSDAEAVRLVASVSWRDTYADLLAASTIEAFLAAAYAVELVERRIARDTLLVVERGDQIVAFADAVKERGHLRLAAIYALPEWRGRGAGTTLLATLRSRFPDLPVSADVLLGNRKGEVFYEHRGFVPRESLDVDLFGESVVERRWWLGPPSRD
jgi:GNAT superfamily N-acetyltransferase